VCDADVMMSEKGRESGGERACERVRESERERGARARKREREGERTSASQSFRDSFQGVFITANPAQHGTLFSNHYRTCPLAIKCVRFL
jgi:hypothetical protein